TQFGEGSWRFTAKDGAIYAIALTWPGETATIAALGDRAGKVASVELIGGGNIAFTQAPDGLHLKLPRQPDEIAYAFRVRMR
ncbi:MAG TPA: alpha-L-fucosidase C-terminal domain-containing protein, partial [Asticcacaulis sp.]